MRVYLTEGNVDQVVAGGAVEAVVPLLTHFNPDESQSFSRYCIYILSLQRNQLVL